MDITVSDEPPWVVRAVARGYVGPTLIRRELEHLAAYAAEHPEGWWYVIDPTDVRPNPVNIVFLKAIGRLPHVRGYLVVARRRPMRVVGKVVARLGGPDRVFASDADALAYVTSSSGE